MRLLTRADLDGITCAVFLRIVEPIDEVVFVEPHSMQTGQIEVRPDDVIANLPYHPDCGMWFDHHLSNAPAAGTVFKGAFHVDPSAARTIFDYYKDPRLEPYRELLEATDKVDAAMLTLDDVRNPSGYVLLSLTIDPRSNLENADRYHHQLLDWLRDLPIDEVLEQPEVVWRCRKILDEQQAFEQALIERSRAEGNVVVTDFRGLEPQPVGSRFLVYALFPQCNVSLKLYPARSNPGEVGISIGHSIFNRTSGANAGEICRRYGGGGHRGAASCVVPADRADAVAREMLIELRSGGGAGR
jgi:hypothetical protein